MFGKATRRRSDLPENASVQQSWATWHHGKQRYKGISTAVPPARAWHNTALHFHKDLGLLMFLTSSERLKPFWPLLEAKIVSEEGDRIQSGAVRHLINIHICQSHPFSPSCPHGPCGSWKQNIHHFRTESTTKEL